MFFTSLACTRVVSPVDTTFPLTKHRISLEWNLLYTWTTVTMYHCKNINLHHDHHLISPCRINILSTIQVTRIHLLYTTIQPCWHNPTENNTTSWSFFPFSFFFEPSGFMWTNPKKKNLAQHMPAMHLVGTTWNIHQKHFHMFPTKSRSVKLVILSEWDRTIQISGSRSFCADLTAMIFSQILMQL